VERFLTHSVLWPNGRPSQQLLFKAPSYFGMAHVCCGQTVIALDTDCAQILCFNSSMQNDHADTRKTDYAQTWHVQVT